MTKSASKNRMLTTIRCSLIQDTRPLPPPAENQEADDALLRNEPWVQAPISMDYGFNVRVGEGVFININCVFIDTSPITIGARTLFGPNVHLYSGTHPVDPAVRNGTLGPETGKEIHIGEDCWLGGNVIVLPGRDVTGRGSTIGAGSVVTKRISILSLSDMYLCLVLTLVKDVPAFSCCCRQSSPHHSED